MDPTGIGNFKGVMLCNRPNEIRAKDDNQLPFLNRVFPKDPLGWNPTKKDRPRVIRDDHDSIINRHKRWLKEFGKIKREEQEIKQEIYEQRKNKFRKVRNRSQDAKEFKR
jgi:hypothetical protein